MTTVCPRRSDSLTRLVRDSGASTGGEREIGGHVADLRHRRHRHGHLLGRECDRKNQGSQESRKGDTHGYYLEVVGVTRQIFPAASDAMKRARPSGAIATPLARSDVAPPAPVAKVLYWPVGWPLWNGMNTTR